MKIRTNDTVLIIAGKNRGKRGKVLRALPQRGRLVVEGINILKRHTKPTPKNPQGGIIEFPGSIALSNAVLICPNCGKPTRIARKVTESAKLRICRKCQQAIDTKATGKKAA